MSMRLTCMSRTCMLHTVQDQHELQDSGNDAVAAGAPAHWRMRVRDSGCRAFQGLTVHPPILNGMDG